MKRTLILASVCTCLLAASTAQSWASFTINPGVSAIGLMSDWAGTPTVTLGNTTWTLDTAVGFLSTLPGTLHVELDNVTGLRITDNNGGLDTGSYTLNYSLALTGGLLLNTVKVDSTLNSGTDTISKTIYNVKGGSVIAGPVTSSNGSSSGITPIIGTPSSIYVSETITVAGRISDFANTYTAVPEPTTMIAGALLLLPFGASTLRVLRTRRTA